MKREAKTAELAERFLFLQFVLLGVVADHSPAQSPILLSFDDVVDFRVHLLIDSSHFNSLGNIAFGHDHASI